MAGVAVERVAAAVKREGVAVLGSAIATAAAAARTPEPAERREGRFCIWRSGPVICAGTVDTGIAEVAVGGEPANVGAGAGAGEEFGTGTASDPAFFHTDMLMLRLNCE